MVQWFDFQGYGLSIEHVWLTASIFFLFPPDVKILAIIEMAANLCLFT